jgi:hypothetical protein
MRSTNRTPVAIACLVVLLASTLAAVRTSGGADGTKPKAAASAPERKGEWKPEVTILGRDRRSVSEAMASRLAGKGWTAAGVSDSLLAFERPSGMMLEMVYGFGAKWHVTYHIAELSGNTRVTADIVMMRQSMLGRPDPVDMNTGKFRDRVQADLEQFEALMSRVVSPTAAPSDTTTHAAAPDTTMRAAVSDSVAHVAVSDSTVHAAVSDSTAHAAVSDTTARAAVSDTTARAAVTDSTAHGTPADSTSRR